MMKEKNINLNNHVLNNQKILLLRDNIHCQTKSHYD